LSKLRENYFEIFKPQFFIAYSFIANLKTF